MIDLIEFVGKKVEIELRNGNVYSGHTVWEDLIYSGPIYKYSIDPLSCRYDRYGNYGKLCNDQDIIKIKEIKEIQQPTMPYEITKQINIRHKTDDFDYTFTADEYGTVCISATDGETTMTSNGNHLYIPKDCIQHIINSLEQFK
jgi:hypothetical protein